MSVKFDQIPRNETSNGSYVGRFDPTPPDQIDILANIDAMIFADRHEADFQLSRQALVSVARYELREGHSPPYSGLDEIPTIKGLVFTVDPDQWGNSFFADVCYNSRGNRATYGGRYDHATRTIKWQCYMD